MSANSMKETENNDLSFLNSLMHHPMVFKLCDTQYKSTSALNHDVAFEIHDMTFSHTIDTHQKIQSIIHKCENFLLLLIFKLLDRNIYISERNVGLLERMVHPNCRLTNQTNSSQHPALNSVVLHCDIMAFNFKKRHVYTITICKHPKLFHLACIHALRIAHNVNRIKSASSTVVPLILTVYNYERHGNMRLCSPLRKKSLKPIKTR
jgi:hypothetical protein